MSGHTSLLFACACSALVVLSGCSGADVALGPSSCRDGKKNGTETDVDCGGEVCWTPCLAGQMCRTDRDCAGQRCLGELCAAATCSEGHHEIGEEGLEGCTPYYRDIDRDGFGVGVEASAGKCLCEAEPALDLTSTVGGDCDDTNVVIHPYSGPSPSLYGTTCYIDADCDGALTDPAAGEACDDNNAVDWDGCNTCNVVETVVAQVNPPTTIPYKEQSIGDTIAPAVTYLLSLAEAAALPDGRFAVAFSSHDSTGLGVFARFFDAAGEPSPADVVWVNHRDIAEGGVAPLPLPSPQSERGTQIMPVAASWSGGGDDEGYVFAWMSLSDQAVAFLPGDFVIYAQRFYADGTPRGERTRVALGSDPTGHFRIVEHPAVAAYPDGSFIVCWQEVQSGGRWGVWCKRYDAAGVPHTNIDNPFPVSGYASGDEDMYPRIATWGTSASGGFAVVYQHRNSNTVAASADFRRYHADGTAIDATPQVGIDNSSLSPPGGSLFIPDIAAWSDGRLVMTTLQQSKTGARIWHARVPAGGTPQPPVEVTVSGVLGLYTADMAAMPPGEPDDPSRVHAGSRARVTAWTRGAGEGYLIAWSQLPYPQFPGQPLFDLNLEVFARRYQADGTVLDAEPARVNQWLDNQEAFPFVASFSGGDAASLVGWVSGRRGQDLIGAGWYDVLTVGMAAAFYWATLPYHIDMNVLYQRFDDQGVRTYH